MAILSLHAIDLDSAGAGSGPSTYGHNKNPPKCTNPKIDFYAGVVAAVWICSALLLPVMYLVIDKNET